MSVSWGQGSASNLNGGNGGNWLNGFVNDQEEVVSRFAALLGSGSGISIGPDQLRCFSSSLGEDAVLCTLPALSMQQDDRNALPNVGEHMSGPQPMEGVSAVPGSAAANPNAEVSDQKVAEHMATKSSWTRSSIPYAPEALAKNLAESFSSLVSSRVKAWTLVMFKQSLATGDAASRQRLLGMLNTTMKVTSASTSLKTLPLPESARGQKTEADVVLPLLFQAKCNVVLPQRMDIITLRAPGTISAYLDKEGMVEGQSAGFRTVVINLDTAALFKSMVDQARLAVFKTVTNVTANDPMQVDSKPAISPGLQGFKSSLGLASAGFGQGPQLDKAKSSALRLNSVLHAPLNGSSLSAPKKSVKLSPMDISTALQQGGAGGPGLPVAQQQKELNAMRLKSIKSFGRAHAGDFSNSRGNATFAAFGGSGGPTWGRDGKMINKPTPIQAMKADLFGGMETPGKNANFSFGNAGGGLTRSRAAAGLGGAASSLTPPSTLQRTPTALENWYMDATSGK